MKKIGLIAGSGQFPVIFSKMLISKQFLLYTIAYLEEADFELSKMSTQIEWIHPGQVGRLIKFFKTNNVKEVVMLGAIRKTKLLRNLRPDIKAISIITKIKTTHDDTVISAFADCLENNGIKIKPFKIFMPELIATKGLWTKRKPSKSENSDIKIGLNVAKEIGKLDVGQSVVVGQGSVLAVEAIEGTDATIKRGGSLCSKKAVLVKICKPNQDRRFDIPAIGLTTIENMYRYNISALAILSQETVVFDKISMINKANQYGMSIICL